MLLLCVWLCEGRTTIVMVCVASHEQNSSISIYRWGEFLSCLSTSWLQLHETGFWLLLDRILMLYSYGNTQHKGTLNMWLVFLQTQAHGFYEQFSCTLLLIETLSFLLRPLTVTSLQGFWIQTQAVDKPRCVTHNVCSPKFRCDTCRRNGLTPPNRHTSPGGCRHSATLQLKLVPWDC